MSITFRTYRPDPLFGEDYARVRGFLLRLDSCNYAFGRWDWMITHSYLDKTGLPRIGIWEEGGEIVALATYDCKLGSVYLLFADGYAHLADTALAYAETALAKDGKFRVLIREGDLSLADVAARRGLTPTQDTERDAVYPIGDVNDIRYTLPDGFSIASMRDACDPYKYGEVLWKGFNHEAKGEGAFSPSENDLASLNGDFMRPNVNLDLKIAAVAPDGRFASYCGMWYDAACQTALVEPVATDPAYRRMGLGRAAVLEAVRRCGLLGAKRAVVGSSQQFYCRIGFVPFQTSVWWSR